jgi:hypothetical protein
VDGVLPLWMVNRALLWKIAHVALWGVGDTIAGEWREEGKTAVHLRRRLTKAEWGDRPWGMDYRGTPEGHARLAANQAWLPVGYQE